MLCVRTIEHPLLGWPASPLLTTFHAGPPRPAHREPRSWEHTATKRALEGLTEACREREGGFDWQERVLHQGKFNWISRRNGGPVRSQRVTVCVWHRLRESGEVTESMHSLWLIVAQACIYSLLLLVTPVSTRVCLTQNKVLTKGPHSTFLTWVATVKHDYIIWWICESLSDANCEKSWSGFVVFRTFSWGERPPETPC